MGDKRRHHYVPAFLLAGFTGEGTPDGYLWVHDRRLVRPAWRSAPRNVAHERDFYRVEGPEPQAIEDGLAKVEALAAPVIRRMEDQQVLPVGQDMDILLNLLAAMATRVPTQRKAMARFMSDLGELVLQTTVASPSIYASQIRKVREAKPDLPEVSYEVMRGFIKGKRYDLKPDQGHLLLQMLQNAETVLRCLWLRRWTLLVAKKGSANFICSDNPVSLVPTKALPGFMSPGWAMPSTVVYVPLTRRMALIGRLEHQGPEETVFADTFLVAEVNRWTALLADRHVFSPLEDFIWFDNWRMRHASEFNALVVREELKGQPPGPET